MEYRYRAVCEVLGGSPIGEVAARFGTSRQSLYSWRQRFQQEGMPGLADRSRRPHTSPNRVDPDVEALVCELRRQHPRWVPGGSAMSSADGVSIGRRRGRRCTGCWCATD
ncbi:leucine zipper domain-containing protein [Saccharopolyspora sp. NPDC050389]|uniref:helix-turn-helix domain-containing protein n=1 Tax=Saccharopolyspora sp. NPDC050389 TaxID=3155516 RepID=UPI0033DB752B